MRGIGADLDIRTGTRGTQHRPRRDGNRIQCPASQPSRSRSSVTSSFMGSIGRPSTRRRQRLLSARVEQKQREERRRRRGRVKMQPECRKKLNAARLSPSKGCPIYLPESFEPGPVHTVIHFCRQCRCCDLLSRPRLVARPSTCRSLTATPGGGAALGFVQQPKVRHYDAFSPSAISKTARTCTLNVP